MLTILFPVVLSPKEQQHILGVQANVWTCIHQNPEHVEYMVNPRLLALSEIEWTNKDRKDYSRFLRRIQSTCRDETVLA
jgi:hexosaminidase